MRLYNVLSKYNEHIYALMRIVVGFLFISHGIRKVFSLINGDLSPDNILIMTAMVIETIGGFLIIIGWFTDWAAFISSGTMAVAYFKSHAPQGLLPINNGGELAVIFSFVFLFIASRGPGIWSVDAAQRKRKR